MLPEPGTYKFADSDSIQNLSGPLVDVRTPEAFAECHIPGSVNHCVYEVAFMEDLPKAYPDRATSIAVYGDGDPYKADLAAVGRLQLLGYENVQVLQGGLERWKADGLETEGHGPNESPPFSGPLKLDAELTKIRWVGRNLTNQHFGEVGAVEGFLELDMGKPVGGRVVVDLRTLACQDITDTKLAGALIGHLQNADFFQVERYPMATFTLREAEPVDNNTYGQPNYRIAGTLAARGKEAKIVIDALIEPIKGGYVFQSNFDFNRVELGACYGSGSLFEKLGMHLVNDLVSIDVTAFFVEREG